MAFTAALSCNGASSVVILPLRTWNPWILFPWYPGTNCVNSFLVLRAPCLSMNSLHFSWCHIPLGRWKSELVTLESSLSLFRFWVNSHGAQMCGPHRTPRLSVLHPSVPPFEPTNSPHTNSTALGGSWEHLALWMPSCIPGLSAKLKSYSITTLPSEDHSHPLPWTCPRSLA